MEVMTRRNEPQRLRNMESDNSEISVGSLLVLGLFVRVAVFFMISS